MTEIVVNRPWLERLIDTAIVDANTPDELRAGLREVGLTADRVAALSSVCGNARCPAAQAGLLPFVGDRGRHARRFAGAFDEVVAQTFDVDDPCVLVVQ